MLDSVCLLNASNSGFASKGMCFGEAAPNERIDDVGGLQLSFGPIAESLGSLAGSTISPK
jgi:nucleoside-specific outer membrane channel protein Tsx